MTTSNECHDCKYSVVMRGMRFCRNQHATGGYVYVRSADARWACGKAGRYFVPRAPKLLPLLNGIVRLMFGRNWSIQFRDNGSGIQ